MSHDQARRELVERLLVALRELVQHQPPCWVRECPEDKVFVHARIQYATPRLHVKGRFPRLAGTTSPAICRSAYGELPPKSLRYGSCWSTRREARALGHGGGPGPRSPPSQSSKTVLPIVKICPLFPATLYCRQYRKPCVKSVSSHGYQAARIPSPCQSGGGLAITSFGFCRENNRLQRQGESDRKGS